VEPEVGDSTESARRRRDQWLGLVVVLLVVLGLNTASLWRPDTLFGRGRNVQIAEAQAWWEGRLDLPIDDREPLRRDHDTAVLNGRVYSHFPLMFTFVSVGLVPLFDGVPHWFMVLAALTVPILAYVLFRRLTGSPWWGALTAIGYVCGTSIWPVLDRTIRTGSPYVVNITVANIGLLVLLIGLSGRRGLWVAGIGLIIASLSRHLTVAFAIPLVWWAFRGYVPGKRRAQLITLGVVGLIVAGIPLTANTLKFGHPLRTGYKLIYEGREDNFAMDAKTYGLFAAHFVPRNLYYANLGFPRVHRITLAGKEEVHLQPNTLCTGIWWTTPLLLWLFVDFRRILSDPAARWVLVAAAAVYVALLLFHATGASQRGYNRFSLDYMPALFAIIAPRCFAGRRRWISIAMMGWSVLYFWWFIQPGSVRLPF
jgi:hypothetical protein